MTSSISALLAPNRVKTNASASSKKRALEFISELAVTALDDASDASQCDILDSLVSREKLGTTAIGQGLALPHGRLASIEEPIGVILTLETPIDFDANDGQQVDVIFAVVVPEENCNQHVQTLSNIATLLNDATVTQAIRACEDSKELWSLISKATET